MKFPFGNMFWGAIVQYSVPGPDLFICHGRVQIGLSCGFTTGKPLFRLTQLSIFF